MTTRAIKEAAVSGPAPGTTPTFLDKVMNVRATRLQAEADMGALIDQMTETLFARLRPLAALSWLNDEDLRHACVAFTVKAIYGASEGSRPIRLLRPEALTKPEVVAGIDTAPTAPADPAAAVTPPPGTAA